MKYNNGEERYRGSRTEEASHSGLGTGGGGAVGNICRREDGKFSVFHANFAVQVIKRGTQQNFPS